MFATRRARSLSTSTTSGTCTGGPIAWTRTATRSPVRCGRTLGGPPGPHLCISVSARHADHLFAGGLVSTADVQVWVAIVGGFLGAALGVFRYFNYRTRRDRVAAVGESFNSTVEALASDNLTRRMAA